MVLTRGGPWRTTRHDQQAMNWPSSSNSRQPLQALVDYWVTTLLDAPPLLELPTDFKRPTQPSGAGLSVKFVIPGSCIVKLAPFMSSNGMTPFMMVGQVACKQPV